jgi:polysaccharide deacetylase family protein (PEP-CTERM system associated)
MNILTFDVEEWFHVLDHESTKSEEYWKNFDYRLDANMDRVLEILDRYDQKATFFCLGWLTKKHTHIIRRLDAMGFEIATHSNLHQLVYEQHIEEFEQDLEYSIKSLEDVTGKKVRAYRAPGFSIKEENRWVFESLLNHGIEIDCSIFPAKRGHGGFPTFGTDQPVRINTNVGCIKEFPMNINRVMTKKVVYSGGGYFRLLPYRMIYYFMQRSNYTMTYFHPHDFDMLRPTIDDLSMLRRFKATVGLKHALRKLEQLICDFEFIDLDEAVRRVDWENTEMIQLPERRSKERIRKSLVDAM